jgi:hypothetical protein
MNNSYKSPARLPAEEPIRERLTGRMMPDEAARVLGCKPHDLPVLIREGKLQHLSKGAPPNSVKYFAAPYIHRLAMDEKWLGVMTKTLNDHWTKHNQKRKDKRDPI